ncbi:MAG: NADH-quinone oxidoreductase subunit NuoE [Planctomycetes bacterium]|nr:NADH-quinone oxidoreductase subunit NuoE [Planctomycetota bacterium]
MSEVDIRKIDQIIKRFPPHESNLLIPILQSVQEEFGYIPPESVKLISRHSKVSRNKIYGVLTFYAQFATTPRGKYVVRPCRGTACHVRGSASVIRYLKSKLKVEDGYTTTDNKFTLETVACLGACFLAPTMMVNHDYYGNLNDKKVEEILKTYR